MRAAVFLDTNILLYAISTAADEQVKKARARELLARHDYGYSAQVMQEFYVNATRAPAAMTHAQAATAVRELALRPVLAVDMDLVTEAFRFRERYRLSYWDAAIIAAATRMEAATVYSEDLSHGQRYGTVTVNNPFLELRPTNE